MATNIPPHNLGELVDVLCVLIHNPEATVSTGIFWPYFTLLTVKIGYHFWKFISYLFLSNFG